MVIFRLRAPAMPPPLGPSYLHAGGAGAVWGDGAGLARRARRAPYGAKGRGAGRRRRSAALGSRSIQRHGGGRQKEGGGGRGRWGEAGVGAREAPGARGAGGGVHRACTFVIVRMTVVWQRHGRLAGAASLTHTNVGGRKCGGGA
eukprot:1195101-Prorocentrum_minimum.AAC.6